MEIEANYIGSHECRFWRTIRVETHLVQTILLALAEDGKPRLHICRRITRQREATAVERSTHVCLYTVDIEIITFNLYVTHSEHRLHRVLAYYGSQGVEVWRKLVPEAKVEIFESHTLCLSVCR